MHEIKYECFGGPLHGETIWAARGISSFSAPICKPIKTEILEEHQAQPAPYEYETYYPFIGVEGILVHQDWTNEMLVRELFERRQNYILPINDNKFDPLYEIFRLATTPKHFGRPEGGFKSISVSDVEHRTNFHRDSIYRRMLDLQHLAFEMWRGITL